MPTKPPLTPFIFASDVLYTTGPALLIGTVTKIAMPVAERDEGWKALQVPPAQWTNHNFNHVTQWTNWVALGSLLAGLDAHIIETDGSGDAAIARLVLGGTANGAGALAASSNAAGAAATFTDTIGSFACLASANGGVAAIRGTNTGTGAGVQGLALGTDNVGGDFNGTGIGAGATCDGGSGGGSGVIATGGGAGVGVVGIGGSGGGDGGDFQGGTLAADGCIGRTTGATARTVAALVALPTGDAAGVRIDPTTGAHFHLVGLAADPSAPGNGDFWYESTAEELRVTKAGLIHVAQTNRIGIEHTLASNTPTPSGSTAAGPAVAVTQAVTPVNPGNVLVTVTAHVDFDNDNASCTVDILDSVLGGTLFSKVIKSKPIGTAGSRGETVYFEAIVAATAALRTFSLRFTSVANTVTWDEAVIKVVPLN